MAYKFENQILQEFQKKKKKWRVENLKWFWREFCWRNAGLSVARAFQGRSGVGSIWWAFRRTRPTPIKMLENGRERKMVNTFKKIVTQQFIRHGSHEGNHLWRQPGRYTQLKTKHGSYCWKLYLISLTPVGVNFQGIYFECTGLL